MARRIAKQAQWTTAMLLTAICGAIIGVFCHTMIGLGFVITFSAFGFPLIVFLLFFSDAATFLQDPRIVRNRELPDKIETDSIGDVQRNEQ